MSEHPSALVIDGLAAGLVDDAAARAHVAGCERCRSDLAAAEAACGTFTREVLPRTLDKLRPARPWWRPVVWLVPPALAAVALVLWLVRAPAPVPGVDDDIRRKGGMTFQVFAHRADEVFAVHDGARLAAGDQIRFVVGSGGPAYLLVASVDGSGKPTVYYPYGGERSGPVTDKPSELPGSIVLDAAPGPERVFALITKEPLDAAVVTRALAALGARGADAIRSTTTLELAAAQASLVFEKVAK